MAGQQHQYQSRQQQGQSRRPPTSLFILLLLLLLLLLAVAYSSLRLGNSSSQPSTEGQCLSHGQQFNGRQEAFTLAQQAEQYRTSHPYNGNYGYASYTLCSKDGSEQRVVSPVAPGYDNTTDKTKPRNYTHSEQALYRWLQKQLMGLSFDPQALTAIYVIIFSQVRVCDACLSDMVSWQSDLRQAAKTAQLYLALWDIRPGSPSAFIPTVSPEGTGTPIVIGDLRRLMIRFIP